MKNANLIFISLPESQSFAWGVAQIKEEVSTGLVSNTII